MPLLVCPNDNTAMQTVNRSGVEFDFCPTCRGIWLDRGELEKIMAAARDEGSADSSFQPAQARYSDQPPQPAQPRYSEPHRSEYRRDWDDDDYRHKKRRGKSIFDIFD